MNVGGPVEKILKRLRAMNVSIAIDDFGTGYSSLSQLSVLPIDTLKIDRSFLHDVPGEHKSTAIVSSIISMANSMGLNIIAEGVEELPQLTYLLERSCNEVQGFLFSKAVPPEAIENLLREASFEAKLQLASSNG